MQSWDNRGNCDIIQTRLFLNSTRYIFPTNAEIHFLLENEDCSLLMEKGEGLVFLFIRGEAEYVKLSAICFVRGWLLMLYNINLDTDISLYCGGAG